MALQRSQLRKIKPLVAVFPLHILRGAFGYCMNILYYRNWFGTFCFGGSSCNEINFRFLCRAMSIVHQGVPSFITVTLGDC